MPKQVLSALPKSAITGKPVLHFAHANGMPSRVYQPLFDLLAEQFSVEYIPILGAVEGGGEGSDYQIDEHWQSLTTQVLDSIAASCAKHGVDKLVGFGHSLGALSTLQAIYRDSTHVAQAVLLDPPWIYGMTSLLWHSAKQLDRLPRMNHLLIDKLSPSGTSKHRRDVWDSREQAYEQLRDKAFFRQFDERCFAGYIEHGLTDTEDGKVTLTIPKANEVAVFRTNPSWYWLTPNQPPKVPVTLVIGTDSLFLKHRFPQKINRRLGIPFVTHQGGHMFPLEHPESVVELVQSLIVKQQWR